MQRRTIVLMSVALIVLAIAAWLALPKRIRARPGPMTFVLVDSTGEEIDSVAFFEVDGDDHGGLNAFVLNEGRYKLVVSPLTRRFFVFDEFTFEPFSVTLSVSGAPTTDEQKIKVTVPGAFTYRMKEKLKGADDEPVANHTLEVELSMPNGEPATGVLVRVWGDDKLTDDRGRAKFGPTEAIGATVWARMPGLVATAEVEADVDEIELTLHPAMDLYVTVIDGGLDRSVAVNSKEIQQGVMIPDENPTLITVPLQRTIVCTQWPAWGACDVIVPPPDGGRRDAVLNVGPMGRVNFEARARGNRVSDLIVYLDRVNSGDRESFAVFPGKHVLVLNTKSSSERYEVVFEVAPGTVTELGVLELK